MTQATHIDEGSVALVTGASSGIGEAVAEALTARGCRVIGAARRVDRLRALAERLGERFHPVALDLTDRDSLDSLLDRLPAGLGEIDILINNAGHGLGGRVGFDRHGADDMAAIIETNVIGLIRLTRLIAPGMVTREKGDIVNVGSIMGIRPYGSSAAYTASKHAVHGFSDCLRIDFAETGLRVIEVLPGLTRTEFARHLSHDGGKDPVKAYDERPSVLSADDVARAVVFALDQPPHVTMAQITVLPSSQG
ncbi:MAG: SDR family oxidoreductase [Rhodospirillales bacterium]|jgi:NADP-dependent 3-hydroxy acid dehydrogenase YdfG|nr:SDR family oxidoreductase [Rhodospirillales bacterium]MDP6882540.1 SDR family oxidoreductase [Rhodospirillales bacterium]